MAVDAHLLDWVEQTGQGVLRLYSWERPTLSLGRTQRLEAAEISLADCQALGIPLVRRMTGGRAVLHGFDLTYSVLAPIHHPRFSGSVLMAYQTISQVFMHLLRHLGLDPVIMPHTNRERLALASANCFATPSAFEILVQGKKLIGSAQRRRPAAFLQHGSMGLHPAYDLLSRIYPGSSPETHRQHMTDLGSLGLWQHLEEARFKQLLVESFARQWEITFEEMTLFGPDLERIAQAAPTFLIEHEL